jgi:hypothetical protein
MRTSIPAWKTACRNRWTTSSRSPSQSVDCSHRPVRAPGQRTQEHDSPTEVGQAPTSGSSWGSKWEVPRDENYGERDGSVTDLTET